MSEDHGVDVYIGSDPESYTLKNGLEEYLAELGFHVIALGTFSVGGTDYRDIAREVGEKVMENLGSMGVIISSAGGDMCSLANSVEGVHAIPIHTISSARAAHDGKKPPNIICINGNQTDLPGAQKLLNTFLGTA